MKLIITTIISSLIACCIFNTGRSTNRSSENSSKSLYWASIDSPHKKSSITKVNALHMCENIAKKEEETTTEYKSAKFVGGEDSLIAFIVRNTKKVNEQMISQQNQLEVIVYFVVDTNGTVKNIRVSNDILQLYPQFAKEAIRVVSLLPNWIPASELDENDIRVPRESEELVPVRFDKIN
ncbi:MAG TPA: hypothetical protein PLW44_06445 [Chitinophagales bacterium]|nr:hypothetical protein [Chitinophagales bacterium]